MSTARLLSVLTAAGVDVTPLQAAEAIWLAANAHPLRPHAQAHEPAALSIPDVAPRHDPSAAPQEPENDERTGEIPVRLPHADRQTATVARGFRVRVPEAPALPPAASIQRALRPLKRRVPTGQRLLLDEVATVDRFAQTRIWAPVLRHAPERWLDASIVFDDVGSMDLWRTTVADLYRTLCHLGAFRDVRVWRLGATGTGAELAIAPAAAPGGLNRRPMELVDPARRRVILVISDATSPSWRDGSAAAVLAGWARHGQVLILQPLPERLWARTGLRPHRGQFWALAPGSTTSELRFRPHRRRPRELPPGQVPVPVAEIDAGWLASWARLVTATIAAPTNLAATLVPSLGASAAGPGGAAEATTEPGPLVAASDPAALVSQFRAVASPTAASLMTCLSATPLSLPVMRLVQRVMLPGSGPTHLAEVILSGLIMRIDGGPGEAEAGFEFLPGVRPLLLDDLRASEARRILAAVGSYIHERAGAPGRTFAAAAGAEGGEPVLVAADPFAWLPAELLDRLGVGAVAETETEPLASGAAAASVIAPLHGNVPNLAAGSPAQRRAAFAERMDVLAGGSFAERYRGVPAPAEILGELESQAAARLSTDHSGRTVAPNRYVVLLSARDVGRLGDDGEALGRELGSAMLEFLSERQWLRPGSVTVEVRPAHHLAEGTFHVPADLPEEEPPTVWGAPSHPADEPVPPVELTAGYILGGRYRLEERIGVGGMGEVWRAVDDVLGRTVAAKVLRTAPAQPGYYERLRIEARTLATISHPGVVDVYDYGTDPSAGIYMVLEYVESESLSRVLTRAGRLTPGQTMKLVAEVADALGAVHERGIVHRDLKPGNLLVRPDGRLVLTDFGISDISGAPGLADVAVGTASYLSPEQAAGQRATALSDIYALGVVAYQCLAGHRPIEGSSYIDTMIRRLRDLPPPLPPEVPRPVRAVVERALAKDPAARWPSANALAVAARRAADDLSDDMWPPAGRTEATTTGTVRRSPAPGIVLAGRYRLDERISSGGMGDVWRGMDEVLGRTVATKILLPSLLDEPGFAERFRWEARAMATINHPGVVDVYDYGSDASLGAYLVMEYIEGEALSHTLHRVGRISPARTMSLIAQAADALHAAHQTGIVHRDVKPANLLVRSNGTLVLTDFGIARSAGAAQLTAAGSVLGTASYIAPEQATGEQATALSDIYHLGVVAYYCLAGRLPFEGDNPLEIAMRHVREAAPPLPPDIPPQVCDIVERAMAKDPAAREPTAAALATAARRAASEVASMPTAAADPWQ